jgi:hypothetical protein
MKKWLYFANIALLTIMKIKLQVVLNLLNIFQLIIKVDLL